MSSVNNFKADTPDTLGRTRSERHVESVRDQGGIFVHAVRVTRMPMMVTDATLPGNPITFANDAFLTLSGYTMDEVLGQDPHFMDGPKTDPEAMRRFNTAIAGGEDESLELLQYKKDGSPFRAHLFASPLDDGQGRVMNHFLSYLDVTRRYEAEEKLRQLAADLERRVALRTQELAAANVRLSALVQDKETLLIEVNHRAKNSLSIAASLLALQYRRQDDPLVRALFQETEGRIHAMARVHDLLSKSDDPQHIALSPYLHDLCDSLAAMSDSGGRVALEVHVDASIRLQADRAIPLGLIVTELITNAMKYAFPAAASGTVTVCAERLKNALVLVRVKDDGIGLSAVRDGSLGYGIVRSLVGQLAGEITVDGSEGVAVAVTFPMISG